MSLPEASPTRTYESSSPDDYSKRGGHCHGCGKQQQALKRCTQCKRVSYCNRECQMLDWKKPHFHKRYCRPGLLDSAMDNIHRVPVEVKLALMSQLKDPPNAGVNQTLAKVACPSVAALLECAERELQAVVEIVTMSTTRAVGMPGSSQTTYTDHERYGLDTGVESLCLALSLWPGVYTVNSCSQLHAGAFVPDATGELHNPTALVAYVADDIQALAQIQDIVGVGALGIRFEDSPMRYHGRIRQMEGFCTIDCLVDSKPSKCRTYGREIRYAHQPFDKLDDALWNEENPPYSRLQSNLVGCLGMALMLTKANPSLTLTMDESQKLASILESATDLRIRIIRRKALPSHRN